MCLMAGAGCVIIPDHIVKNPASLVQALATHRVTHLAAVPTLLHALIPYLNPAPHSCRGKLCHEVNSPEEVSPSTYSWPSSHTVSPIEPSDRQSAAAVDTFSERQSAVADDTFTQKCHAVAFEKSSERHRSVVGNTKLRLRVVVSSGEPLTLALAQAVTPLLPPGCRLLNLYGSAEVAADCTCFDISMHSRNGHDVPLAPDARLHASMLPAASPDSDSKAAASPPGSSFHAIYLKKLCPASPDAGVKAFTAAPTATQHAQHAAHTGQQLSASDILPDPALPAAQASVPSSAAASISTVRQGTATALEQPGVRTQAGPLSNSPSPFRAPLSDNPQVAVGWPLDGFAVCILAMTTALPEETPSGKLPGKQALHSSSSFTSSMQQHMSGSASQHDLSHAKKRKIGLTDSMSEAGPWESATPAETGMAQNVGDELAGTVSIVAAGVVGEIAVAASGLALGYYRYGLKPKLCYIINTMCL